MTGLSILLVDDHPVVREGYRRLLERQPGFRVCAEADDAQGAYQAYKDFKPDVVVMDIAMPGASGVEAVRHIRQWDRNARILIFSMHLSAAVTLKAFEAGASGFVTKSSGPAELIRAVSTVASGGRVLSPDVSQVIAADRLAKRIADRRRSQPARDRDPASAGNGDGRARRSLICCVSARRRFATITTRSKARSARATMRIWSGSPSAPVSCRSTL